MGLGNPRWQEIKLDQDNVLGLVAEIPNVEYEIFAGFLLCSSHEKMNIQKFLLLEKLSLFLSPSQISP